MSSPKPGAPLSQSSKLLLSVDSKLNEKAVTREGNSTQSSELPEPRPPAALAPGQPLNSAENGFGPSEAVARAKLRERKNLLLLLLLCKQNFRLSRLEAKMQSLQGRLEAARANAQARADCESPFRNRVRLQTQRLRRDPSFEQSCLAQKKGANCLVCNTGNCVYDEDVLLYCDGCSVMVHQMCVGVDSAALEREPWFCATCRALRLRRSLAAELRRLFASGAKSRGASRRALENLAALVETGEPRCVMCGRWGGVFFEVEGLRGEFCHASCAFWLDELSIAPKSKDVIFLNEEEFCAHVDRGEDDDAEAFLFPRFRRMAAVLEQFFAKKKPFARVEDLRAGLEAALEGSPREAPQGSRVLSQRRRRMLEERAARREEESEARCACLFSGSTTAFVKRRILQIVGDRMRGPRGSRSARKAKGPAKWLAQMLSLLNSKSFFADFLGRGAKGAAPCRAECRECGRRGENKCCICGSARGLAVHCYERGCRQVLHVECARRVDCELGFPMKNLSSDLVHSVYCGDHSKSPGERTRENFRKLHRRELAAAERDIRGKWNRLLGKRGCEGAGDGSERENEDRNCGRPRNNFFRPQKGRRPPLRTRQKSALGSSLLKPRRRTEASEAFFAAPQPDTLWKTSPIIWDLQAKAPNKGTLSGSGSEVGHSAPANERDSGLSLFAPQITDAWPESRPRPLRRSGATRFSLKRVRLGNF